MLRMVLVARNKLVVADRKFLIDVKDFLRIGIDGCGEGLGLNRSFLSRLTIRKKHLTNQKGGALRHRALYFRCYLLTRSAAYSNQEGDDQRDNKRKGACLLTARSCERGHGEMLSS